MWSRILYGRTRALQTVFNGHFVEAKALYAYQFQSLCNVCFIGDLNTTEACTLINQVLGREILSVYQHIYIDHGSAEFYFNNTIYMLKGKRLIELGNNYCQILYRPSHNIWARELAKELSVFRIVQHEASIGFAWQVGEN